MRPPNSHSLIALYYHMKKKCQSLSKLARKIDCANRRGMIRYKRTKEIYKNTKEVHKYKRKRIKVQKNKKHKRKKSCQKWQLYLYGLVFWLASSTGASSSVTRVTFSTLTYPRTIIFRWNIEKTAVRLESSRGINFAIFKLFKLFQYG